MSFSKIFKLSISPLDVEVFNEQTGTFWNRAGGKRVGKSLWWKHHQINSTMGSVCCILQANNNCFFTPLYGIYMWCVCRPLWCSFFLFALSPTWQYLPFQYGEKTFNMTFRSEFRFFLWEFIIKFIILFERAGHDQVFIFTEKIARRAFFRWQHECVWMRNTIIECGIEPKRDICSLFQYFAWPR